MKRDDILWKALLEDIFDDFLRFFFPDADSRFDFSKDFEFLDKELEQLFPPQGDEFAPLYVDKLIKVHTVDGNVDWILVHIEVQGYAEDDFPKRMFRYYSRIADKYDRPITAFAIFTDSNKNFYPIHHEVDYLGTKLFYSFNTFKIMEQDDALLHANNNPFAIAVLTAKLALTGKKVDDQQIFNQGINLAKRLFTKQIPKLKIQSLMYFLRYYIRFDKQEMITKFENEISTLTEGVRTMGIEEFLIYRAEKQGIEQGRQEEREKNRLEQQKNMRETAIKMMNRGVDIEIVSDVTGFSIEQLKHLS